MAPLKQSVKIAEAEQLLSEGRYLEARGICAPIVARSAKDVDALHLLGRIEYALGNGEAAATCFRKLLRTSPRNAHLHGSLGDALKMQGAFKESIASYEKVLKLSHGLPAAIAGLADSYEKLGHNDKAGDLLLPFVRDEEEDAFMAIIFARVSIAGRRFQDAIDVLMRHVEDADTAASNREMLHFMLGKAHERAGDIESAFQWYEQANALQDNVFDADAFIEQTDKLIDCFSEGQLTQLPRCSVDAPPGLVFIVGMPRSGSTLVEQVLDAHPDAGGIGESQLLPELAQSLMMEIDSFRPYPECVVDLAQEDVDRLAIGYIESLRKAHGQRRWYVDKQLGNYMHLGLIELLFPQAIALHCRRDPLDTCFSCYAEWFAKGSQPFTSDLRSLGIVHNQKDRLMEHWSNVLTLSLVEVDYASLVHDLEAEIRRLLDHCSLDWNEACLRFFESGREVNTLSYAQVRQPVYTSSVGRANKFDQFLAPLKQVLDVID